MKMSFSCREFPCHDIFMHETFRTEGFYTRALCSGETLLDVIVQCITVTEKRLIFPSVLFSLFSPNAFKREYTTQEKKQYSACPDLINTDKS